jgi:hypothetical protein
MSRIATLRGELLVEENGIPIERFALNSSWAPGVKKVEETTISSGAGQASFTVPSGSTFLLMLFSAAAANLTLCSTSNGVGVPIGGANVTVFLMPLGTASTLYLTTIIGSAGGVTTLVWLS